MNEKQFEFLLYQSAEEDISVNALIKDDTIWLTQKAMAELFDCSAVDTPHGESRGILGSTTTACPCEVLHGVPERIGLGVSRPTIYADYANRRSPSLRMFVAAFMSLSWCSPHSGQTHSRTARSFVPVH